MGMKDAESVASVEEKRPAGGRTSKTNKKGNALLHAQRRLEPNGRAPVGDNKSSMAFPKGSSTKKECTRISEKEDAPSARLVKIELDAAEALAEFSRIALLPTWCESEENADTNLQWFGKRKRSRRINKEGASEEAGKEARMVDEKTSKRAFVTSIALGKQAKALSSQVRHVPSDRRKGSFLNMETDELEESRTLPESSKDSLPSDSRAESPSSPLPSLQLECRAFLVGGSAETSAFQRVVSGTPVDRGSPLSIKTKIEDIHIDVPCISTTSAHKMAVKRKQRAFKHPISAASVKVEQCDVNPQASSDQRIQGMVRKNFKDITCQSLTGADSGVESLLNGAVLEQNRDSELRVSNKQKVPLTEIEKEERRLRRIQANRESARQTIRRKQILCEELTKRASSLASENESMKQKREILTQELQSLKDQNCHLREQLAMQSSSNFGLEAFQQAGETSSQQVSLPVLPVPVLPYAGMPLQSYVWTLAVAQATAVNQTSIALDSETISEINHSSGTLDTSSLGPRGIGHCKLSPVLFPHPSYKAESNQVSTSSVSEQQIIGNSSDCCSPLAAQNEISAVLEAHRESSTLQGTRPSSNCQEDCNPPVVDLVDVKVVSESLNSAGLGKSSNGHSCIGTGLSSGYVVPLHASSLSSQTSKSGVGDNCGSSIFSAELGQCLGNVTRQLTQALNAFGLPSNGSKTGVALDGSLHACSFTERKTSAASIAAAEARRRRKELTRTKFLQSRGFRLHC